MLTVSRVSVHGSMQAELQLQLHLAKCKVDLDLRAVHPFPAPKTKSSLESGIETSFLLLFLSSSSVINFLEDPCVNQKSLYS